MGASSPDQAKAWQKVGREFETLGGHLRESFDQVSTGAAAERRELERAARQLIRTIEKGFGVGAPLVNDPRLKSDVKSIGAAIRAAVEVTLAADASTAKKATTARSSANPTAGKTASRRPATKRTATKRTATKRTATKRTASKRTASKRTASKRTASKQTATPAGTSTRRSA